jgi:cytochrome c6
MKNSFMTFFVFVVAISVMIACTSSEETVASGEAKKEAIETVTSAGQVKEEAIETVSAGKELFKEHCAVCHHNGENSVEPEKTLHKKVREKNGIKSAEDIIQIIRDPGPRMIAFDETDIPDKDAKQIAEYILKTF